MTRGVKNPRNVKCLFDKLKFDFRWREESYFFVFRFSAPLGSRPTSQRWKEHQEKAQYTPHNMKERDGWYMKEREREREQACARVCGREREWYSYRRDDSLIESPQTFFEIFFIVWRSEERIDIDCFESKLNLLFSH